MASAMNFDEKSAKYFCCFKRLHIRAAARAVSVALIGGVVLNLLYSFGRSSTVMIYSWILASFAVGVYGSLTYAVFKEKRTFTMPFMVFQAVFIILCGIIFLVFLLNAMFSTPALQKLASDFGGLDPQVSIFDPSIRGFVMIAMVIWVGFICMQCWFFEIIYRFYQYLEDRETSFAFQLEPDFRVV